MSTIVAISTAPGIGGIGIIRISGEKTYSILEKIFKTKSKIEPNKIIYGKIINKTNNKFIDEVLVSCFKAPKSYTKEDLCEINCHGGNLVIREILELCLENGAELAEPGEFTKRAFLNGRIDLVQAESIIDIINSKTQKEKEVAISQLQGFLSDEIEKIKDVLLKCLVEIEVGIDYPEYDIEEIKREQILSYLEDIGKNLVKLSNSFENGKIISEGIKVAIIGRPNAGKSSLLNKMLKEERAIVTDVEGTTRDTIEEIISIDGIPIRLIDTAGIRNSDNLVEKIGINKSIEIAKKSDLIIALIDNSKKLSEEDKEITELIKDKKAIIVLNKTDLKESNLEKEDIVSSLNKTVIKVSALKGTGIDDLYKEISKIFKFEDINCEDSTVITNVRHKNLINNAIKNVELAKQSLQEEMPIDIIAINIREILECMNTITGDNVTEDIIKEIFSKFCLGK